MTPRRSLIALLAGAALTLTTLSAAAPTAAAATAPLTLIGNNSDNVITVGRTVAGQIVANVPITGTPTVANTDVIQVFGLGGNDTLTVDESNGAMPRVNLFGGTGNDTLIGGSSNDMLFGQAGNDALQGRRGIDVLLGGDDSDTLTGGDGNDQVFGENGNDRAVWNTNDDSDLAEGGAGGDVAEVNTGNGSETISAKAVGVRIQLSRLLSSPAALDIGSTETLTVNLKGGNDTFATSGAWPTSVQLVVDGGAGDDHLQGSSANDVLVGSDGTDVVAGGPGDDVLMLGAGDDASSWSAGDGKDVIEGQTGTDRVQVNGSDAAEQFVLSSVGQRARLVRAGRAETGDSLDVSGLEVITLVPSAGVDRIGIGDLSGTDVREVHTNVVDERLPDGSPDLLRIDGTAADDLIRVTGGVVSQQIAGLPASITVTRDSADRVAVAAGGGDDIVDASPLLSPAGISVDGGAGNDVLKGSPGDDRLSGGDGDDVLLGGDGTDTLDGGPGTDVLVDGEIVTDGLIPTKAWLAAHARTVDGTTVLDLGGKQIALLGVTADELR